MESGKLWVVTSYSHENVRFSSFNMGIKSGNVMSKLYSQE
jgi:hypothetical protein